MTKENILQVAIQEFSLYGYDAVSMNQLASKLKVNKATIYYHYKDKKSLYQSVLGNLISRNKDQVKELINSKLEPKEMFRQYINLFINNIKETPQIIPLTLREMANLGVNVEGSIEEDLEENIKYLASILSKLNLKNHYKDIDPYIIKALMYGTINTYYSMQMSIVNLKTIKDLDKNTTNILNYTNEFISNILIDSLCED